MNTSYLSGKAALFAGHARQEQHICTWCLEKGSGSLVYVNGRLVLSTHLDCMSAAGGDQSGQCCCYKFIGDNASCPVHGGSHAH